MPISSWKRYYSDRNTDWLLTFPGQGRYNGIVAQTYVLIRRGDKPSMEMMSGGPISASSNSHVAGFTGPAPAPGHAGR